MNGALYELACSVEWCMEPQALEAFLSIAARDPLPADEIARRMHGERALAQRNGKRRDDSGRMTMQGSVAVIPIDGPIYRYADMFTAVSGGVTTEALSRDLALARADPAVSAVLFVIDSPGGEVTGTNEFAQAIAAMRGVKPTIAYIEGYGTSAAYWFASAADYVIVDATAKVGSIGVVMSIAQRAGRGIDFVSSQSPRKRADPTTEEGRAYYQAITDSTAEVFVTAVMRNRKLSRDQILAFQGGILVGQQAIDAGLADAIGSEEQTIQALQSGALLLPEMNPVLSSGSPAPKETKRMAKGFWAWMAGESGDTPATPPPALASEIVTAAATLQPVQSKQEDDDRAVRVAAENAELRQQLARVQAERITADAEAFAKAQITAGHALPVEQQAMIRLYVQAAQDDADRPIAGVTEHTPSRVALVTAAYAARPANNLASNLLPSMLPANASVLTNAGGESDLIEQAGASARAYAEKANGKK